MGARNQVLNQIDRIETLRKMIRERDELLEDITESVKDVASPRYVSERDWNEDAHIGKITITVKDARRLYKLMGLL